MVGVEFVVRGARVRERSTNHILKSMPGIREDADKRVQYGALAWFELPMRGHSDGWVNVPLQVVVPRGTDTILIHVQLKGVGHVDLARVCPREQR